MSGKWILCMFLWACSSALVSARVTEGPRRDFRPDSVIVAYKNGISTTRRAGVRQAARAVRWQRLMRHTPTLEAIQLPAGTSVLEVVKKLQENPDVRFAEPNYRISVEATSDDPYYLSLIHI